ncbi:MAG: O-methyltransferase [Patescibacteria group bacterium]
MDKSFIQAFLKTSSGLNDLGKKLTWEIPASADKHKGDLGLLPEDINIGAWQVPTSTAQLLRFLILITKSKTILELGTSIGFSTIWLALGAKENGGHVYGTEIFPEKAKLAKKHFEEAGVSDQVTLLEEDILDVLKNWKNEQKIDFVFMDADKQRYDQYLEKLLPIMNDNALIAVDNVGNYPEHMQPFLEKCTSMEGITVHFLNIDFGVLLILKNPNANIFNKDNFIYNAQRI